MSDNDAIFYDFGMGDKIELKDVVSLTSII